MHATHATSTGPTGYVSGVANIVNIRKSMMNIRLSRRRLRLPPPGAGPRGAAGACRRSFPGTVFDALRPPIE